MIASAVISQYLAWLNANPEHAVLNELRTHSVSNDAVAAARIGDGVVIPASCPVTRYDTIAAAMAAHPDLPWHQLTTWSGEPAEPELLAAREAVIVPGMPVD